jgi:hypothetical protein
MDSALDQTAQVVSITVQVAKGEQAAHSSRAYRLFTGGGPTRRRRMRRRVGRRRPIVPAGP